MSGLWEHCAPFLAPALRDGDTLDGLKAEVEAGTMWLWPGERCAGLTELVGRDLHIRAAGGSMDELKSMLPSVEVFAKAANCTRLTLTGRVGWVRVLPGFRLGDGEVFKEL